MSIEPETDEATLNGSPPRKKRRQRISYAERCQEHERDRAAMQSKLSTILTLLRQTVPEPGSAKLLETAVVLLGECIE